ncbi:hypothetical protein F2Q69_00025890, partial [Brassica cretica]
MEAEVAQQEVKTRAWSLECKSPSKKAFMLGLIALGCLLAAHFITVMIGCIISAINIADRLPGFEHTTSRRIHMACISLTWIVATAGAGILTMGIWMNRESRPECGFTNKHFLSLGGKVCFLHAIVSVFMYIAFLISYTTTEVPNLNPPLLRCRWSLCSPASSFSTFALSFPFGSFPILCPLCVFLVASFNHSVPMWTRTWTEASLVAPVSWSECLKSVCYYSRFKTLRAPRHLLLWGFPSSFLSFHRVFCRRSRDPASLTNSASAAKDPSKLQVTPDVPEASIYLLMLCLYY